MMSFLTLVFLPSLQCGMECSYSCSSPRDMWYCSEPESEREREREREREGKGEGEGEGEGEREREREGE